MAQQINDRNFKVFQAIYQLLSFLESEAVNFLMLSDTYIAVYFWAYLHILESYTRKQFLIGRSFFIQYHI